jgi:hypothetical protein
MAMSAWETWLVKEIGMEHRTASRQCPDRTISILLSVIGKDASRGMSELDMALHEYPKDARLHFLKGSLLAGRQDYAAARDAMGRALALAPGYHVARFQLGFLLLTSGEAIAAQDVWGPLHALPPDHYLRLFTDGLGHLIRDDFAETVKVLEKGIALNKENPPMNRDMQLIIEQAREKMGRQDGPVSSVDFLLQQAALKPRR